MIRFLNRLPERIVFKHRGLIVFYGWKSYFGQIAIFKRQQNISISLNFLAIE